MVAVRGRRHYATTNATNAATNATNATTNATTDPP
jgi:hypothetical protein